MLTTIHVTLTDPFEALSHSSLRSFRLFPTQPSFIFSFSLWTQTLTRRRKSDDALVDRDLVRSNFAMTFGNWVKESLLCLNWWPVRAGISSGTRTVTVLFPGKTTTFFATCFCIFFVSLFFFLLFFDNCRWKIIIINVVFVRTRKKSLCWFWCWVEKLRWWLDDLMVMVMVMLWCYILLILLFNFWFGYMFSLKKVSFFVVVDVDACRYCAIFWDNEVFIYVFI